MIIDQPPCPTLLPYTTLFRSIEVGGIRDGGDDCGDARIGVGLPRRVFEPPANHRQRDRLLHSIEEVAVQPGRERSEEHTSELQSHSDLVCRLLLEKQKLRTVA